MRQRGYHIVSLLLLLCTALNANAQKRNNITIADNHLVLLIDLTSTKSDLDSILKIAGITNANADMVLKGDLSAFKRDGWDIKKRQKNTIVFERSLTDIDANPQSRPYLITANFTNNNGRPGYPGDVNYGVNKLVKPYITDAPAGFTRFFLPGYLNAKKALLSGSFNGWSTLKGIMTKTDKGWVIDIKLDPGKYNYKYIVDGHWLRDGNNTLKEDDGLGNINSVYFKYNYFFKLLGFQSAKKITIAGSFNNWDANELELVKAGDKWLCPLYLHEGTHAYRFMVDGRWITDPANPVKLKDAAGNVNSILNLGETVNFKLNGYQSARKVYIAGEFNNWKPFEIALNKTTKGWGLPLVLAAGNYLYKFIVDGNWITDPANPHSGIGGSEINSFVAVKPNHTFKLSGYSKAHSVRLSGNFNDWNPFGYTMAHTGNEWTISIRLKPGKYRYKYIVDGQWILDPGNKLWEQNEFNTGNSVLWME